MSLYQRFATGFAVVMIGLGLAMIALTLAHGFGIGVLLGLLFMAAGAGRIYVMRRSG